MWVLKLKVDASKQISSALATKHRVAFAGNPLSYYKDKNWVYLITTGVLFGEEKDKEKLIKEINESDMFPKAEFSKDFAVVIMKQPLFTEPLWDPRIIRLNPAIVNLENMDNTWSLASFEREPLEKVLKLANKYMNAELIKFKQEKISNISFTKLIPEITDKQKRALELAIKNGYYEYPKKIKMEELAKIMGVSYSTYQAHLKKAEGKLLPQIYKGM